MNFIKYFTLLIPMFILSCSSEHEVPTELVNTKDIVSNQLLKKEKKEKKFLYFGFDLRGEPQEDVAQYLPFIKYLEKKTGLIFKLHISPSTSSTSEELGLGHADFSIMGSLSYLEAESLYGAKILVRGVNDDKSATYRSVFVTRTNSNINKINDIKGSKLAFGSKDSTQGHLIPRVTLKKHGIFLSDFKKYDFTGSHQKCAEAVISRHYDVCAMQEKLAKKLVKQGLVKIIYTSLPYPSSGIAVNSVVSKDIVDKVQKALLDFDPQGRDKPGLYNWKYTEMPLGFVAAKSKDYDDLRDMANKLGLLQKNSL